MSCRSIRARSTEPIRCREKGGILFSELGPSTATSNDARLFIDQYDGLASDTRALLYAGGNGIGINTSIGPIPNNAPGAELTISSSGGDGHETWIDLLSAASASAVYRGFNLSAAADAPPLRYSLSGTGTLRFGTPTQSATGLRLKATLLEKDAALAASPPVQESGPFALMAAITAAPSVCYSDTIFRDDFDGDGY